MCCEAAAQSDALAAERARTPDVERNQFARRIRLAAIFVSLRERFVQLIVCLDQYKLWSWRAAWGALRASKRLNARAVIASGPPMTNLLAGLWVARFRRIPFIADFRDPWYSGFELSRDIGVRAEAATSMERVLVQRSTAVIVTTDLLAQRLMSTYPQPAKDTRRAQWLRRRAAATADLDRTLPALPLCRRNLCEPRSLRLLSALERLLALEDTDASRVSATFVGTCETYRGVRLADWLHGKRCAAHVRVLPPVATQVVEAMKAEASVLLNFAQAYSLYGARQDV